ncbi:hypothetical protein [Bacillus toyonensis]|nr:hypothetical protein [Bacillus toyonensis]
MMNKMKNNKFTNTMGMVLSALIDAYCPLLSMQNLLLLQTSKERL